MPYHQSQLLAAALEKAGVPVRLYTVKGAGHGGFTDPQMPELTRPYLRLLWGFYCVLSDLYAISIVPPGAKYQFNICSENSRSCLLTELDKMRVNSTDISVKFLV